MENQIEALRTALRDDADSEARHAGLMACREILAVLETATDGESAAASNTQPQDAPAPTSAAAPAPAVPPIDPTVIAGLVASLGKLPPEQLLDLAISRLRAALPPGTTVSAPRPLRFQLIPLHHLERSK